MSRNRLQLRQNRLHNLLQMCLIVVGLGIVVSIPAWVLAGSGGVAWALLMAIISMIAAGSVSPRLVLVRAGAGPLARCQAPRLYAIADSLFERAGMRGPPVLYYVPDARLNAFAVGNHRNGGIALTEGLLRHLNLRQLTGVLAHEVSHLLHNDTRVMAMADAMTRLTAIGATLLQVLLLLMLPWILAGQIQLPWLILLAAAFAPSISTLLQLALSRNREFSADLEAAVLTGDPRGLAAALKVLEHHDGGWLESLFGNPGRPSLPRWLQTHPPTGERIRRLLSLEPGNRQPTWQVHPVPGNEHVMVVARPRPVSLRGWLTGMHRRLQ